MVSARLVRLTQDRGGVRPWSLLGNARQRWRASMVSTRLVRITSVVSSLVALLLVEVIATVAVSICCACCTEAPSSGTNPKPKPPDVSA